MISPISPLTDRQRFADHFSDIICELLDEGAEDAVIDMAGGFIDALNSWDEYLSSSQSRINRFRAQIKQSL